MPVISLKTAVPSRPPDGEFVSIEISVTPESKSGSQAKTLLNGAVAETCPQVNCEKNGEASRSEVMFDRNIINKALQSSRSAIVATITETIETQRAQPGADKPLYDLLMDYPSY